MITVNRERVDFIVIKTAWGRLADTFKAAHLAGVLRSEGVTNYYRAADRLLQQWRKAGIVTFRGRQWHKTGRRA